MKSPKRDFKGIWIPASVWLDHNLTAVQKVLLAEIDSFTSREQVYFKANETIAHELGCSVSTIKRGIQCLINLGYIERVSFDGRKRALKSTLTLSDRSERPDSKVKWTEQTDQNELADGSKRTKSKTKSNTTKHTEKIEMPFPDLTPIWEAWKEYRKTEHNFKYKHTSSEQVAVHNLAKLSNYDRDIARRIVEQSIANGWKGLFPIRSTGGKAKPAQKADLDKFATYIRTGNISPDS